MRAGWISGGCLLVWIVASLSGEETKKVETAAGVSPVENSASTTASEKTIASEKGAVTGKKSVEAVLRRPAKLDFGGRTKVTAEEILGQLREKHDLSIRFDVPTFVWLFGADAFSSGEDQETPTPVTPPSVPTGQPAAEAQNSVPATAEGTAPPTGNGSGEEEGSGANGVLGSLTMVRIDVRTMNLESTSIGTMLNQLLGSIPVSEGEGMGLPIPATNAMTLDYIVEEDGILITTRMQALTRKETRVYSVKNLKDCPPDQLAKLIRKTIRPYSWRAQFDDFGDKLKGVELPTEAVSSLIQAGAAMAELENVTITTTEGGAAPVTPPVVPATPAGDLKGKKLEAAGNALANIFVALTHAGLLTVEMLHYGDPPTATIEVLPGKIVVTQSQSAHREIAELLEELSRE